MLQQLLIEAFVVGIAAMVIGTGVGFALSQTPLAPKGLGTSDKDWNKYYVMEISLFLTGFLSHIIFEFAGANKWYLTNSVAAMKMRKGK